MIGVQPQAAAAIKAVVGDFYKRVLSLPMFPGITYAEQRRIVEAISSFSAVALARRYSSLAIDGE